MRVGSGGWASGASGAIVEYWELDCDWDWVNVDLVWKVLGIVADKLLVCAAGVEGVEEEEVEGVSGDGGAVEVVVAKTLSK